MTFKPPVPLATPAPVKPSTPSSGPRPAGPAGPSSFPRPRPASSGGGGGGRFGSFQNNVDEHRINEQIRVPQVRLIDENGGQLGIVATFDALKLARDKGLDLMEVAATTSPPVCKICDYGKYKYEKKKKEHQARKKQTVIKVKEVQLRPNTDDHDREYKFKNIRQFLEDGDKAKITVMFRGREVAHTEPGFRIMKELIEFVKDVSTVESFPKMDGKKLIMILAPVAAKKPASVKASEKEEKAEKSDKAEKPAGEKVAKKEKKSTTPPDSGSAAPQA